MTRTVPEKDRASVFANAIFATLLRTNCLLGLQLENVMVKLELEPELKVQVFLSEFNVMLLRNHYYDFFYIITVIT